jgi:PAS domain S-box-containing protein
VHYGLNQEFIENSSHYDRESPNTLLVMKGLSVYSSYPDLKLPKSRIKEKEGLHAFALIPVRYEDRIICCLNLASHTRESIDKTTREILETIAAQVASAIARLKAETSLYESEHKYRELFELESDAIFLIDNQTGQIMEANSAATALYGYTRQELLALKNIDLSAEPEDTQQVTRDTPVLKDNIVKIPLRLHRKMNGTVFPVEITGRFFMRKGRPVHIAAIRDITARKQAEEALRERMEFEQLLAEISTSFLQSTEEDIEPLITQGLKRFTEFLHVDRGSLYEISPDGLSFRAAYSYKVSDFTQALPLLSAEQFPYYVATLKRGEKLAFNNIEDAPPEAEIEKNFCRLGGIRSVIALPLLSGKSLRGTLTFVSRKQMLKQPYELYDRLQLIGELFMNLILRKKAETERDRLFTYSMEMLCIQGFDGYFKELNPAFEKTLGWSKEEFLNKPLLDLIHPADRESTKEVTEQLKKGIGAIAFENRCLCKYGIYKWILWNSFPLPDEELIFAVAHDITSRKLNEEALAAEKELLSVTLRSIGDAVISTDTEGCIVLMNNVAEKLTGWKLEQASGKPLTGVFHINDPETGQPSKNPIEKVLESGSIVTMPANIKLTAKEGAEYLITSSGAPIKDKNNTVVGVVLVFRDITERQKIEQNILKTQKLESLGLLAGGIAHDFNNLLSGIFGFIDMAKEKIGLGENAAADLLLTKALDVYERAKNLTQQLLTFAKGGEPVKKTGRLDKTVLETVQFALSGSNVRVEFIIADNLWLCDFDANQIGQAVDNIVINAKHAMPKGGLLKVSAWNTVISKESSFPLNAGEYVCFSFQDHGKGIAKEHLPKIFDPFFTTKKSGSGLGLTTCYSIIKKHDGHIEVESTSGRGTTLFVYLPASRKKGAEKTDTASLQKIKSDGRILVMDDEDFMREITTRMLEHLGCTVLTTSNGEETVTAFKKAVEQGNPFSAVILDLTIPGSTGGREIVSQLLEIDAQSYIIAASGYSDDPIMSSPLKYGFKDRLKKPFKINELRKTLEDAFKTNGDC